MWNECLTLGNVMPDVESFEIAFLAYHRLFDNILSNFALFIISLVLRFLLLFVKSISSEN